MFERTHSTSKKRTQASQYNDYISGKKVLINNNVVNPVSKMFTSKLDIVRQQMQISREFHEKFPNDKRITIGLNPGSSASHLYNNNGSLSSMKKNKSKSKTKPTQRHTHAYTHQNTSRKLNYNQSQPILKSANKNSSKFLKYPNTMNMLEEQQLKDNRNHNENLYQNQFGNNREQSSSQGVYREKYYESQSQLNQSKKKQLQIQTKLKQVKQNIIQFLEQPSQKSSQLLKKYYQNQRHKRIIQKHLKLNQCLVSHRRILEQILEIVQVDNIQSLINQLRVRQNNFKNLGECSYKILELQALCNQLEQEKSQKIEQIRSECASKQKQMSKEFTNKIGQLENNLQQIKLIQKQNTFKILNGLLINIHRIVEQIKIKTNNGNTIVDVHTDIMKDRNTNANTNARQERQMLNKVNQYQSNLKQQLKFKRTYSGNTTNIINNSVRNKQDNSLQYNQNTGLMFQSFGRNPPVSQSYSKLMETEREKQRQGNTQKSKLRWSLQKQREKQSVFVKMPRIPTSPQESSRNPLYNHNYAMGVNTNNNSYENGNILNTMKQVSISEQQPSQVQKYYEYDNLNSQEQSYDEEYKLMDYPFDSKPSVINSINLISSPYPISQSIQYNNGNQSMGNNNGKPNLQKLNQQIHATLQQIGEYIKKICKQLRNHNVVIQKTRRIEQTIQLYNEEMGRLGEKIYNIQLQNQQQQHSLIEHYQNIIKQKQQEYQQEIGNIQNTIRVKEQKQKMLEKQLGSLQGKVKQLSEKMEKIEGQNSLMQNKINFKQQIIGKIIKIVGQICGQDWSTFGYGFNINNTEQSFPQYSWSSQLNQESYNTNKSNNRTQQAMIQKIQAILSKHFNYLKDQLQSAGNLAQWLQKSLQIKQNVLKQFDFNLKKLKQQSESYQELSNKLAFQRDQYKYLLNNLRENIIQIKRDHEDQMIKLAHTKDQQYLTSNHDILVENQRINKQLNQQMNLYNVLLQKYNKQSEQHTFYLKKSQQLEKTLGEVKKKTLEIQNQNNKFKKQREDIQQGLKEVEKLTQENKQKIQGLQKQNKRVKNELQQTQDRCKNLGLQIQQKDQLYNKLSYNFDELKKSQQKLLKNKQDIQLQNSKLRLENIQMINDKNSQLEQYKKLQLQNSNILRENKKNMQEINNLNKELFVYMGERKLLRDTKSRIRQHIGEQIGQCLQYMRKQWTNMNVCIRDWLDQCRRSMLEEKQQIIKQLQEYFNYIKVKNIQEEKNKIKQTIKIDALNQQNQEYRHKIQKSKQREQQAKSKDREMKKKLKYIRQDIQSLRGEGDEIRKIIKNVGEFSDYNRHLDGFEQVKKRVLNQFLLSNFIEQGQQQKNNSITSMISFNSNLNSSSQMNSNSNSMHNIQQLCMELQKQLKVCKQQLKSLQQKLQESQQQQQKIKQEQQRHGRCEDEYISGQQNYIKQCQHKLAEHVKAQKNYMDVIQELRRKLEEYELKVQQMHKQKQEREQQQQQLIKQMHEQQHSQAQQNSRKIKILQLQIANNGQHTKQLEAMLQQYKIQRQILISKLKQSESRCQQQQDRLKQMQVQTEQLGKKQEIQLLDNYDSQQKSQEDKNQSQKTFVNKQSHQNRHVHKRSDYNSANNHSTQDRRQNGSTFYLNNNLRHPTNKQYTFGDRSSNNFSSNTANKQLQMQEQLYQDKCQSPHTQHNHNGGSYVPHSDNNKNHKSQNQQQEHEQDYKINDKFSRQQLQDCSEKSSPQFRQYQQKFDQYMAQKQQQQQDEKHKEQAWKQKQRRVIKHPSPKFANMILLSNPIIQNDLQNQKSNVNVNASDNDINDHDNNQMNYLNLFKTKQPQDKDHGQNQFEVQQQQIQPKSRKIRGGTASQKNTARNIVGVAVPISNNQQLKDNEKYNNMIRHDTQQDQLQNSNGLNSDRAGGSHIRTRTQASQKNYKNNNESSNNNNKNRNKNKFDKKIDIDDAEDIDNQKQIKNKEETKQSRKYELYQEGDNIKEEQRQRDRQLNKNKQIQIQQAKKVKTLDDKSLSLQNCNNYSYNNINSQQRSAFEIRKIKRILASLLNQDADESKIPYFEQIKKQYKDVKKRLTIRLSSVNNPMNLDISGISSSKNALQSPSSVNFSKFFFNQRKINTQPNEQNQPGSHPKETNRSQNNQQMQELVRQNEQLKLQVYQLKERIQALQVENQQIDQQLQKLNNNYLEERTEKDKIQRQLTEIKNLTSQTAKQQSVVNFVRYLCEGQFFCIIGRRWYQAVNSYRIFLVLQHTDTDQMQKQKDIEDKIQILKDFVNKIKISFEKIEEKKKQKKGIFGAIFSPKKQLKKTGSQGMK